MALRFPSAALKHDIASCVQLELIESTTPARLEQPPCAQACPNPDDLLDFCRGSLLGSPAIALQHHLDLCPTCMHVVTLALNDWDAPTPAEWLDVASNFHPGDRIDDRYEVVRFLASGGMGEVYEARDLRTSERVALKAILAAASDNRDMLRAFRREARLARRVRHPNVCHVHDAPTPDGVIAHPLVPYFTLDLIDGETLHERLAAGPLPLDQTLELARQILLGIQAIHGAGVLHLDLKSNNIMLVAGATPRAVILDFGLARSARGALDERVRPLVGCLPFTAPEQLAGSAPSVQNDVFAFGVVLFQMLTGELPSARHTPPPEHLAERLMANAPAAHRLQPAVFHGLEEVVLGCLASAEERFGNVGEVLDAVNVAMTGHCAIDAPRCLAAATPTACSRGARGSRTAHRSMAPLGGDAAKERCRDAADARS